MFIIATIHWPKYTLYLFFVFYLGILYYFYYFYKQFSFRKLKKNLGRVVTFWIPVVLTFFGLYLANYIKVQVLPYVFPGVKDGTVQIIYHNELLPTLMYATMMIVLKPVAEELFFRKAIIKFGSTKKVIVFTILSLLLCALSRANGLLGIAEWMLMALPVTIAYVATRNIYISLMAHVLFEFYDNIYSVVYSIARIFSR
ncbi:CPBP family intramembrane metalloprotease [Butyrivibrio sp. CB08]|uniref:CPBP family glutamic-type intramembrane protease n=1 Tax=Butyrivibrio sp. CB08 TaxID=2364879 RepID=UPI000EAA47C6|nr:CPBP family glutamic-type intramembrane protease [Butyrivibrio sp. CB08]RKM62299.1 CPBP family intramembrane metalloprotease [Butyrivibrio sp. CB08]